MNRQPATIIKQKRIGLTLGPMALRRWLSPGLPLIRKYLQINITKSLTICQTKFFDSFGECFQFRNTQSNSTNSNSKVPIRTMSPSFAPFCRNA
jgi:hypothetical protein